MTDRIASAFPRWKAASLSFVLALALAACGEEYPQSTVSPGTDFAEIIHSLYTSVFWWSMVILAVVWGLLAYILVRFRERPGGETPKQTHGHLGMEIGWTIGPALIVVAIAIPTIQAVFATQRGNPEADYTVEVVGHRFWWEFRYPDSVVTANELHLPVGRPIALKLHSADVIHSFWVPRLGGKRDVNPIVQTPEGEEADYTWLYFTIREPGVYSGQCAEFCGPSHALMGLRVVAQEPAEFEAWLADWKRSSPTAAPTPPDSAPELPGRGGAGGAGTEGSGEAAGGAPGQEGAAADTAATPVRPDSAVAATAATQDEALIAQGRDVFFNQSYCVLCHAIEGTPASGALGPNLTLFGRRGTIAAGMLENTPENLVRWIREPREIKPGAEMPGVARGIPRQGGGEWQATGLSDEQLRAVAAYLSSLR